MKTFIPLICASIFLTGCATNPFAQFYKSYTTEMPVAMQQRLLPSALEPKVISAAPQNHKEEGQRLEERGYICIGFSGFTGGAPTQKQIIEQAKKVGADVVIHTSEYSHTEQGVQPLFTYQPGQTSTTTHYGTANANVYGSRGYAYGSGSYSGTSTTTTPGTLHTDYVPYQRRVHQHGATYWRRTKPGIFGARLGPIPDDLRSSLQRNTGVFIAIVMQDGPAFRANILRGDVVIQLADKPVATVEEFIGLLPSYAGQKVAVKVLRGTQTIDIDVQLAQSL